VLTAQKQQPPAPAKSKQVILQYFSQHLFSQPDWIYSVLVGGQEQGVEQLVAVISRLEGHILQFVGQVGQIQLKNLDLQV